MKRGAPLQRRTPLSSRPKEHHYERPPAPVIDLDAARRALAHRQAAEAAPAREHSPVPDPVRPPKGPDGSFSPATRSLILARDEFTCQNPNCGRRVDTDSWPGYSLQHRVARGAGGTSDPRIADPDNGLTLCGSATTGCHGWVETDTTGEAERLGLAVPSWADPETVPVRTPRGWVRLDRHGGVWPADCPPGGDARLAAQRRATSPLETYLS